ncbi:MAG: tRNA (guanosine(37)-N1)-methyltransferase TrmD [Anaerolineae bacterium]|nr:tRNA (guanosine(37)-N1)-methyltransferase TrmD [Anaerolineae bacterium]
MRIDILTLFPQMFSAYLDESILRRAQSAGLVEFLLHNLRDFGEGKHRVTDEPPFGGGGGMVLKPGPIFAAVDEIITGAGGGRPKVVLLSPQGRQLTHAVATELAMSPWLLFICGRYEGVDERVRQYLVDDEISIGDYVLTGGELAALVAIDALARHIPGVLGDEHAAQRDSFANGLLEGPHYTRPEQFRDWAIPPVLRTGHAGNIARWRREQALRRTWELRPELLLTAELSEEDRLYLMTLAREMTEGRK